MDDTISRKGAIEALNEYFVRIGKLKRGGLTSREKAISLDTTGAIRTLPSAQPDIIRCHECAKRRTLDCPMGITVFDAPDADGYCYKAERRKDGSD